MAMQKRPVASARGWRQMKSTLTHLPLDVSHTCQDGPEPQPGSQGIPGRKEGGRRGGGGPSPREERCGRDPALREDLSANHQVGAAGPVRGPRRQFEQEAADCLQMKYLVALHLVSFQPSP